MTLSGVTFDGKENSSTQAKVGDSLKFVWKDGFHNVVSTGKVPAGAKKTNSGAAKEGHAPLTVKLTKKGTYSFECVPHAALMKAIELLGKRVAPAVRAAVPT